MDIQAATARYEAATCQNPRYEPAEYVTHDMAIDAGEPTMQGTLLRGEIREPCGNCDGCYLRIVVPAALEALEEAQEENRQLRKKIGHWVAAYSPDIIAYPSGEAVRAVNSTPEFIVGRNAMMQTIHEGLSVILGEGNEHA